MAYPGRTLPILSISYKGDAFDPENRHYVAAGLLAELAFGPNSQLYKKLVLDEQKVQILGGEVPMNRDPSLFDIVAMVKKSKTSIMCGRRYTGRSNSSRPSPWSRRSWTS